jgi:hypothetical protein
VGVETSGERLLNSNDIADERGPVGEFHSVKLIPVSKHFTCHLLIHTFDQAMTGVASHAGRQSPRHPHSDVSLGLHALYVGDLSDDAEA